MNIDTQMFIALVSGLLGTLVGAVMTGLGSLFRTYRDDKRVLKRVLYNQLDLWKELRQADVGYYLPVVLKHIEVALMRRGIDPELIMRLIGGSESQMRLMMRAAGVGNPAKVAKRYEESVSRLAEIDPILAHRISSMPTEDLQHMESVVTQAKALANPADSTVEGEALAEHLIVEYSDEMLRRDIKLLEKDILTVARRVHIWTRFSVSRLLKEFEHRIEEQAAERIDKELDNMIRLYRKFTGAEISAGTQR